MQLIKLSATASTNSYLKRLAQEKNLEDFTVVVCGHQTGGRGQKGNTWISESGKNLTVSILKKFDGLPAKQGFAINCLVSLALNDVLNQLSIPEVKVKWPNDIMSGNQKLCGILIENSLRSDVIKQSIIGFGLNVNQTFFDGLPNATSLKLASGKNYDLDVLLEHILNTVHERLENLKKDDFREIKKRYETSLFRKGICSTMFNALTGKAFEGTIRGITETGQLSIELTTGEMKHFNFKEVSFVY